MKYYALDIETSGTNPEKHQVLEVGLVFEDTNLCLPIEELPRKSWILDHTEVLGSFIALNINKGLIETLSQYHKLKGLEQLEFSQMHNIWEPQLVMSDIFRWICKVNGGRFEPIVVAGKNVAAFDVPFMKNITDPQDYTKHMFHRRTLDPTIYFIDWKNDSVPPTLEECKKRAGFADSEVAHDAVSDGLDIIRLIRHATNNYTSSTLQEASI